MSRAAARADQFRQQAARRPLVAIHANAHRNRLRGRGDLLSLLGGDGHRPGKRALENDVVQLERPQSRRRRISSEHPWTWPSPSSSRSRASCRDLQDSMTQSLRLSNAASAGGFYVWAAGHAGHPDSRSASSRTEGREELASSEHREAIARAIYASHRRVHAPLRPSACARADAARKRSRGGEPSARTAGPRISCAPSRSPRLLRTPRARSSSIRRHQGHLHGVHRGEGAQFLKGQGKAG